MLMVYQCGDDLAMGTKAHREHYRGILARLKRGEDVSSLDWKLFHDEQRESWAQLGLTCPSIATGADVQKALDIINRELGNHIRALASGRLTTKEANIKGAPAMRISTALQALLLFYASGESRKR